MPKISVLMPVYNTQTKHLKEAIESILNQTYKDFELIILNDASTIKNVEEIVLSYDDKRIIYLKNKINLGISPTRNKLVTLAKGKYLAIMDHDDISLPTRFEKQVEILDNNKKIGVVGSWRKNLGNKKVIQYPTNNNKIEETLLYSCCIAHPASMIRKEILPKDPYKEEFSPSEDYALWCKLIGKTEFHNIPEVLFHYRDHRGNVTHSQSEKMKNATLEIYNFVRKEQKDIWEKIQNKATKTSRISLFGIIPFLKIKKSPYKTMVLLFDFIPILKIKTKIKH